MMQVQPKYGVTKQYGRYICARCGNKKQELFGWYPQYNDFEAAVVYCRACLTTTHSTSVEQLKALPKEIDIPEATQFIFAIPFSLTKQQHEAVVYIQTHLQAGERGLVHAVCGAGKTEIIATFIAPLLKQGQHIGWTIARRDVVIEIAERLRMYFPETPIVALYQDSPDLSQQGQLTVLTTARLYDFYQHFDVLVVDENDAFPFNMSDGQRFAADNALAPGGKTLHISATITKKQRATYQQITTVAERFHGYPLPKIQFMKYPLTRNLFFEKITRQLLLLLTQWVEQQLPVFMFVSSKRLGKTMQRILTKVLPTAVTCYVSSDIVDRSPILAAVRQQAIDVLVTTTILERGVTFKNLQVLVLDADNALFDAQTLIQIAGRVGRNSQAPGGKIIFCYQYYVTPAMRLAQQYHMRANEGQVFFL